MEEIYPLCDILKDPDPFDPPPEPPKPKFEPLAKLSEADKQQALPILEDLYQSNINFLRDFALLAADDFPAKTLSTVHALEREVFRTTCRGEGGTLVAICSSGLGEADENGRRILSIQQRQIIFTLTRHPVGHIPVEELEHAADSALVTADQIATYITCIQSDSIPGLITFWQDRHLAFRKNIAEAVNKRLSEKQLPIRIEAGTIDEGFSLAVVD